MPECRICWESDDHLIAPCRCSGTQQWIHRECLYEWRAYSPEFNRCGTCQFTYVFDIQTYSEFLKQKEDVLFSMVVSVMALALFGLFELNIYCREMSRGCAIRDDVVFIFHELSSSEKTQLLVVLLMSTVVVFVALFGLFGGVYYSLYLLMNMSRKGRESSIDS